MLSVRVRKMIAWAPGSSFQKESSEGDPNFECFSEEKYSFKHINANQGRRLSELTKTSVDLALRVSEALSSDHIVFSSRHGELANCVQLLSMIGSHEVLSPTLFSQSVHNTAIGTYTLFKKTKAPTTAISGGRDSLVMGLVSCAAYLSENPTKTVLYICADEKVPLLISEHLSEANRAFAIAMVLSAGDQGRGLKVESEALAKDFSKAVSQPQGLDFLQWFFSGKEFAQIAGESLLWKISKC